MSYSFESQANTKNAVKRLINAEFDNVVALQQSHKADRASAQAAAFAMVDVLQDDPSKDILVRAAGSLGGRWCDDDIADVYPAQLTTSAALVERKD